MCAAIRLIPSKTAPKRGHLEGVLYYRFVVRGRTSTVSLVVPLKSDESALVGSEKHFMDLKRASASEAKFLMVSKSTLHLSRESH